MEHEQQLTVDQVIETAFDFSSYSEEEKQKLVEETSSMIIEAALLRSLTDASQETQEKFQALIEGESSEDDMTSFIQAHFPDFQKIVLEELEIFLNSEDAQNVAPKNTEE